MRQKIRIISSFLCFSIILLKILELVNELFSPDSAINHLLEASSDFLWTYILMGALIICGLYFTYKSRFAQFRMVPEMFRLLTESTYRPGKQHISSFQAFAVSVATRVGTGNLAGVATAIALGGPGAVFWMWVIALVGEATAFVESTLAQLFKRRTPVGSYIGGPAYYILYGLHSRIMSVIFAVLLILTFGLSYNSIQSNTICSAMQQAFGLDPCLVGIGLSAISLAIVFGGIRRVARVSSILVPVMAIGYFLLAIVVLIMNIEQVPLMFKLIFQSAFGVGPFAGGAIGATMIMGIKRGLFSNEAGEGSAPNVAATADVSHPVKQGLIQALGVFTDTIVVCSCTAFIILMSGVYTNGNLNGIALTQVSMQSQIGAAGSYFLAFAILLFAFSSIIGNYYYGEANVRFLTNRRWALIVYRIMSGGVLVMFGAIASLDVVWSLGDLCMALLTACNLLAITLMGKYSFRLLDDYRLQKQKGINSPVFTAKQFPELENDLDAWK